MDLDQTRGADGAEPGASGDAHADRGTDRNGDRSGSERITRPVEVLGPDHGGVNGDSELPTGSPESGEVIEPGPRRAPAEASSSRGLDDLEGPPRLPLLVGLGASAGGLQPLQQFFDHIPAASGAAFVVIQHLSPDFKSLMQELLSRHTSMKVRRIEQDMPIEPDTVYLIPPKRNVVVSGNVLRLTEQTTSEGPKLNFPIDVFFESLAENMRERAVAVIFSGTGSDGTRGVRAINEAGGIVLVQDPDTSQFDGMPRSAIGTGLAHYVQAPDDLARTVYGLVKQLDWADRDGPLAAGAQEPATLARITDLLRSGEGLDFSHYKPSTLARRISRRVQITGCTTVDAYVRRLAESAEERSALRNDLLIGVTQFFRDPAAWDKLSRVVLPGIVHAVPDGETLRLWVTACSTGEEAYTLAILVDEAMRGAGRSLDVKIFATDIDKNALAKASQGVYGPGIVDDVGAERLARYFVRQGTGWRVSRPLREMVIFAEHNLTRDAPLTKMQLVTCRNVLIYMQPALQQRVLATLHYALTLNGVLFLGAAERVGSLSQEFRAIDAKWSLYVKHREAPLTSLHRRTLVPQAEIARRIATTGTAASRTSEAVLSESIRAVLSMESATCLVVGEQGELLQAFGEVDKFLRVPEGPGTSDLSKLIVPDLKLAVTTALHRVGSGEAKVRYSDVRVQHPSSGPMLVEVQVTAPDAAPGIGAVRLVVLKPAPAPRGEPGSPPDARFSAEATAVEQVSALQRELQQTRESLQAAIEELQTTNEEQQASSEELLASNEQLQSTNEELQSVNEELYTVNVEYQNKIQELTELNNDLDHLLRSTDLGIIFLDSELRVRKFTLSASRVVPLMPQDAGRPIAHISHALPGVNLDAESARVIEEGVFHEREALARDGTPMLLRFHPYAPGHGRVEGVVITVVDISAPKRVQRELEAARETLTQKATELQRLNDALTRLAGIVESSSEAIVGRTLEGVVTSWNAGAEKLYGYSAAEAVGRPGGFLCPPGYEHDLRDPLAKVAMGAEVTPFETKRLRKDGTVIEVLMTVSPVRDHAGRPIGAATIASDITERKRAERELRESRAFLNQAIDALPSNLAIIDHEGRIHVVNDAWRRFGLQNGSPDPEGFVGANYFRDTVGAPGTMTPEARALFQGVRDVLDGRRDRFEAQYPCHSPTERRWFAVLATPFSYAGSRWCLVSHTDISERRNAEEDLAAKNRELERFVYTVSHDLKSPVVTVSGTAGALREALAAGRADLAGPLVDTIESTALRMHQSISDLLELSMAGRVSTAPEPINPRALIADTLAKHKPTLTKRGIDVDVAPNLPSLRGDPRRIATVLDNLLSNAIKYGCVGAHPRIEIAGFYEGPDAIISVRDFGPGIAPEHHERVFGLFERLADDRSGTGVGLAIVRRIMEAHGGRCWIESEPGKGAAFFVRFPGSPVTPGR